MKDGIKDRILEVLKKNDNVPIKKIAKETGTSVATASKYCYVLEAEKRVKIVSFGNMKIVSKSGKSSVDISKLVPIIVAVALVLPSASTAIPNFLNVQGKLTNINDEAQTGEFNFTFRIYNQSSGGTLLWQETKLLNTTGSGYWSTLLGSATALNLTFNENYFLEVVVGGETLSPRFQLTSSAYTFHADQVPASNVTNGTFQAKNYVFPENVTIGKTLTAANLSGSILCSNIAGGSDSDYCSDGGGTTLPASNITNGTFGSGDYTFPANVVINKNLTVSNNVLFVDNNTGYVGVGTATPNATLEVRSDNALGAFSIRNTTGTSILFVDGSSRMVGIGMTNPGFSLGVADTIGIGTGVSYTNPRLYFSLGTGGNAVIQIGSPSSPLRFNDNSGNNLVSLLTNTTHYGYFGIGTLVPSQKLNVNGSLRIDNSTGSAILFVDSNTGQVGIGTTSPTSSLHVIGTANITGAVVIDATKCTSGQVLSTTAGGTVQCVTDQTAATGTQLPASNVTNGTFSISTGLIFTFPNNLTVTGNLSIDRLVSGWVPQSQITGITIPLVNASWNGVTGLTFGTNVTFSGVTGLTFGNNVTFSGLTISAANVTNATFSSSSGLVFTFPNNLTVTGNLSIDRLSGGWIDQSRIAGITIPLVNASWNGVSGLAFGSNVTFNGVTGLTFTDNVTGQLPQSRISGITIPASNVTNGTFAATNYVFPENVTVNKLTATNLSGSILCNQIVGGSDSDYCNDASGFQGVQGLLLGVNVTWNGLSGLTFGSNVTFNGLTISAANVTNATFSSSSGLVFTFPNNLTVTGNLSIDRLASGWVPQSQINGITIPLANASWNGVTGLAFGTNVTFNGVSGLALGTNVTWNGLSGLTFGNNVTFSGVTGLTFGTNVTFSGLTGLTFTDNITGQLPQSRIAGITIPATNITNATFGTGNYFFPNNVSITGNLTIDNLTTSSAVNCLSIVGGSDTDFCADATGSGGAITIEAANVSAEGVFGANTSNTVGNYRFPRNLTIGDKLIGDLSLGFNVNATAIASGTLNTGLLAANVTELGQTIELGGETDWNGVTGLTFGTNVTFNGVTGLTFGTNVTFNGVTGLTFGNNVTFSGLTISAGNVTNASAFSTATGLVFTFPNNVTVVGNLSASNLTGKILCSQIVGGGDSDFCSDSGGAPFVGDGSAINSLNATALVNGLVNTGLLAANVTELGQTIELGTETDWNGVTGLTFGTNVTFSGVTGLTFGNNVTFSGLTISAANVTNATFSSASGLVFTFPNNLTVRGNLTASNLTGKILCSEIVGGSDSDYCADATNVGEGIGGPIPAANISGGVFGSSIGAPINYTFVGNVFFNATDTANASISYDSYNITLQGSGANFTNASAVLNVTLANIVTDGGYAHRLGIFVNQSERMSIDSVGNVGIGTTSPQNKLQVIGPVETGSMNFIASFIESGQTMEASAVLGTDSIRRAITVQGNGAAYYMGRDVANDIEFIMGTSSSGKAFAGAITAHDFGLRTDNVDRIIIKASTGNVGIGTTSPSTTLDVNGTFRVINQTGTIGLYQSASGSVGIGTTNPQFKLDVSGTISGLISQANITGITIPLVNASWNGVTGLAFGTNVTFNGVSGLTFANNVTGDQLPQSRISGITIPAANITNATFGAGNYFFQNNVSITGNLTIDNLTTGSAVNCLSIVGGSDTDFCADASGFEGVQNLLLGVNVTWNGLSGLTFGSNVTFNGLTISAANVTNATFSSSSGLVFTFPNNLTVTGNLSIDRLASGWVPQSQITGITIPLVNASWNGVTGLTFGTNVTFNGVTGLTFGTNVTFNGITLAAANLTAGTFGGTTGYTFPENLIVTRNLTVSNNILFVNNDTGRVGIGTTSPNAVLNIIGPPGASKQNATPVLVVIGGAGVGGVGNGSTITLIAGTGGTGSGGAGGTPGGKGGSITITAGLGGNVSQTPGTDGAGGSVSITGGGGGVTSDTGGTGGDVILNGGAAGSGSAGNVLLASARGLVGINTTSPAFTLHVAGTTNITGAVILGNTKCSSGQVLSTTAGGTVQCVTDATSAGAITLEAANISAEGVFGANTSNPVRGYTFPSNLTVSGNLSIERLVSGWVPQSQINGITIPLVNASWNGVTGLTFGTNVTFNGVSSLALGTNVTWTGITISQSNITGITIPANNVTNGTFAATNYVFPENVTVNKLTATNLSGSILCSNIVGGSDSDYCADSGGFQGVSGLILGVNVTWNGLSGLTFGSNVTFNGLTISAANVTNATFSTANGLVFTFPNNLTVTGNLSIDRLSGGWIDQSRIAGITIPLVNASWNGVSGLAFGTNVTFNGVSGLTFANNVTGDQLPQSRISGITIPAANVTGLVNGVFSTASSVNYNNTAGVKFGFGTSTVPTNSSLDIKYNLSISQQNNVANNTWQLFFDTTGTCKSKMGYNGTHFVITSC